jgi:hypothetical protein
MVFKYWTALVLVITSFSLAYSMVSQPREWCDDDQDYGTVQQDFVPSGQMQFFAVPPTEILQDADEVTRDLTTDWFGCSKQWMTIYCFPCVLAFWCCSTVLQGGD